MLIVTTLEFGVVNNLLGTSVLQDARGQQRGIVVPGETGRE